MYNKLASTEKEGKSRGKTKGKTNNLTFSCENIIALLIGFFFNEVLRGLNYLDKFVH